jgi:type I restriction-modification system DNA methylase subunit
MAKKTTPKEDNQPLEKKLWSAADKLRKNMDAAEYKHVVSGLIFLKYISDAFEELYQKLSEGKGDPTENIDKAIYVMMEKLEVVQQMFNEQSSTSKDIKVEEPLAYYKGSHKFNYNRFFAC